jgi:hypothetical protein
VIGGAIRRGLTMWLQLLPAIVVATALYVILVALGQNEREATLFGFGIGVAALLAAIFVSPSHWSWDRH